MDARIEKTQPDNNTFVVGGKSRTILRVVESKVGNGANFIHYIIAVDEDGNQTYWTEGILSRFNLKVPEREA